jgi:hypothetical protein
MKKVTRLCVHSMRFKSSWDEKFNRGRAVWVRVWRTDCVPMNAVPVLP